MAVRRLPDLTPTQVVQLQDALLSNADALLTSALAVLDLSHVALARSLAILGLEESGKAIAVHERRMSMGYATEAETFRCDWLDELWPSHQKKLEKVHGFLVEEPHWFDVEPPDPDENAAYLGTVKAWSRRHDRSKNVFEIWSACLPQRLPRGDHGWGWRLPRAIRAAMTPT
jgi:AbiV family abortive infection protein